MIPTVAAAEKLSKFDPKRFLSTIDGGSEDRGILQEADDLRSGRSVRCCFYIQKGKVRLTVVSKTGKEAIIGTLNEGDFFGEGCLTG
jgi:CRP-like cAMP-binding protein